MPYIISELLFDNDDMIHGAEEEDDPYESMIPFLYVAQIRLETMFFAIARYI